ncbi:MAG: AGE family epimerase/isomerase [Prolixibacteraceae bacterium]|nr:AGE family epimerase/isomerase [Prolixibacteraceae bacterium]
MKKILLLFIIAGIAAWSGKKPTEKNTYLGIPVSEIETAVTKHLTNWFPKVIDTVNGGYYTNFEYNWEGCNDQDKMIVTQARDMWTASRASQLLPDSNLYRQYAQHGFNYLVNFMWDKKNGGFYLYYQPDKPLEHASYKLIYGNAFALYALAEYAKINPSEKVFSWINKTFNWIDSVAHDDLNRGYYNLILDDELKKDTQKNRKFIKRQGWGQPEWKGQNTSIHLLEALTAVYKVMPSPKIRERLAEMLVLVRDTMVQPDSSLKLYFTSNWEPINHSKKPKHYIQKNIYNDHISFGHNIETAYLIIDAAETLYGKVDTVSLKVAKALTAHSLKYGFDENFHGLFDKGYVFNGQIEIVDNRKTWWSQFEALHTLALMNRYFPNNETYPKAFAGMWNYIKRDLYDHEYSGYYNNGLDMNPYDIKERKAHNWKGPYHDGRALMQIWLYTKF